MNVENGGMETGGWKREEGRGKVEDGDWEVEVEVQSSEMRNEKLIEVTEESKAGED